MNERIGCLRGKSGSLPNCIVLWQFFFVFVGWINLIYYEVDKQDLAEQWGERGVCMRVQLLAILWTVAHQAPLSLGFSSLEYWSGLPCPPPGDLPHPGIRFASPALQVDFLPSEPPGTPRRKGIYSPIFLLLVNLSFWVPEMISTFKYFLKAMEHCSKKWCSKE